LLASQELSTVIRDWNFARAWLLAEMSGQNPS